MSEQEINYYGGDYRHWRTAKKRPERKDYEALNVTAHVFPEDIEALDNPLEPFNYFWLNTTDKYSRDIDTLMDRGYFRVIANRLDGSEFPNARFLLKRLGWRSGPEGTVIRGGKELWAQPAAIGIKLEDEERARLARKRKEVTEDVEKAEANLERLGGGAILVNRNSPSPAKGKRK